MKLERQIKIALDESRLLILGAQVLFGFQFNGIFQQQFASLPFSSRVMVCSGLTLIMLAVALLIAPSMEHRIVERGQDSPRILALASLFAGTALLPIAIALAFDMYAALEQIGPNIFAASVALTFFGAAMLCWYGIAWIAKRKENPMEQASQKPTPPETQINQLLTEARVIIPGVQAMLGFQRSPSRKLLLRWNRPQKSCMRARFVAWELLSFCSWRQHRFIASPSPARTIQPFSRSDQASS